MPQGILAKVLELGLLGVCGIEFFGFQNLSLLREAYFLKPTQKIEPPVLCTLAPV